MLTRRITLFCLIILFSVTALTAAAPNREIIINVPGFTLYVYENGIPTHSYPIAIGDVLRPSVLGQTQIINRVVNPTYYPPRWWERDLEPIPPGPENPVGTRWLGLGFPGYGIHGTNQPDSIGGAASAGCIRMFNHDVEELANLVTVGTPVALLYETVLLERDPLLGTRFITVYEDVYDNQTNSPERLQAALRSYGWKDVHPQAAEYVLQQELGQRQPLPIAIPLEVNNVVSQDAMAVAYGTQYYIPLMSISDALPGAQWQNARWWGTQYVEVREFARRQGYGYAIDTDAIELFRIELLLGEQPLPVSVFVEGKDLWLPINALSNILGLPLTEKTVQDTKIAGGVTYAHQTVLGQHGVTVEWEYPNRQAHLRIPQAYLDDLFLGNAIGQNGEGYYVPINQLTELDISIEWLEEESVLLFEETYGIETTPVGNLYFVPDWIIHWLMPGAELRISYP